MRRWVLPCMVVVLIGACSRGGDESGTSLPSTTLPAARSAVTTTPPAPAGEPLPTSPPGEVPAFEVRHRSPGEGGDVLVVLVDPGSYTDLDLENLVGDVMEEYSPVLQLHVVDDVAALAAVLEPEEQRTAGERALLEAHYLARLDEGVVLTFLGPYAEYGQQRIGS